ncbi:hypothetical protein [Streptomyces sp. NPDC007346]|uniref:hypothetical protein n=1 Tax=Streptomyces sp. NPDC007346 TaxID=3154682 RepID=UPI003455A6AB
MEQSGSTMGEEPTWGELLLAFLVMGAIPVVVGGAIIFSLVGLVLWVRALLRRRNRPSADSG